MDAQGEDRGSTVRVSDSEREAVAIALREHCGEGRLDLDELSERLETTFSARTREELDRALVDLPGALVATGPPGTALAGAGAHAHGAWVASGHGGET